MERGSVTRVGRRAVVVSVLAVAALLSACGTTPYGEPAGAPTTAAPTPQPVLAGYLTEARLTRLAEAVPAPSADGSATQIADRALSDRYRALESSDRWLLATAHAELSPELARQHFDCALGVRFSGTQTPRLNAVLGKILHDANEAAETAKARQFRPRPVGVDMTRPACVRISEAGRRSPSYPSGSASVGAAYGEVMAAIDPAHAAEARAIAHQIGVSRIVCAMHYPDDVAAGEALGKAVFAEAAATPAFKAELDAVRAELADVRRTGLTNPGCVAERAALAMPLPPAAH
jgi:acid phosphatase (class A)